MRLLSIEADDAVEREVRLARIQSLRAALAETTSAGDGDEMVVLLQRKYQARLRRAEAGQDPEDPPDDASYGEILRRAQAVERRMLSHLRATGVIGDDAFHRIEEELDWAEVSAETQRRN
jgi:CPA1 family monovalent cation:H+ antiporter